jgi:hypothetical protein
MVDSNGLKKKYHAIANNTARERSRFHEESDSVIDDGRRLLPAEWATEQAEQKRQ